MVPLAPVAGDTRHSTENGGCRSPCSWNCHTSYGPWGIESTRTASFTWCSNHQTGQERSFSMVSKSHVHCNYLDHCARTRFAPPKYMDITASSHLPDCILFRLDSGGRDISESVISRGMGGLLCRYTPLALMPSTRNLKYGPYE
eukprot:scaffold178141_cov35-Attheya_sp.AAC.2